MDWEFLFNRLTNTINKNRPAEPAPVVFVSSDEQESKVTPNRSPRWQRSTKRIVIIAISILTVIFLFVLRNMITPLIFSCLLVFYLGPLVRAIRKKWKISHKLAVIIVFAVFLIITLGLLAAGGVSLFGQAGNFFDLLNDSMDNLPVSILEFLGGENSTLGRLFARFVNVSQESELNQQIQSVLQRIAGWSLGVLQSASSKIGWFFFVYGFSFFILWESKGGEHHTEPITIPGYEFDIRMGRYHLSLIWQKFLWGQAMLMLITLVIYTILFFVFRVRYAFILACLAALTQLVPYVGSFLAWTVLGLVALSQGSTIFHMQPLPYAILVVVLAFLIDKFKDGFIQPKFLAQTLKVHPAAVLAAAIICARGMGFLGIFLAAPLVATLKLLFRYVIAKLRDEDPWENIETVDVPVPLHEYFQMHKQKCAKIYHNAVDFVRSLKTRIIGGKEHGSNGY